MFGKNTDDFSIHPGVVARNISTARFIEKSPDSRGNSSDVSLSGESMGYGVMLPFTFIMQGVEAFGSVSEKENAESENKIGGEKICPSYIHGADIKLSDSEANVYGSFSEVSESPTKEMPDANDVRPAPPSMSFSSEEQSLESTAGKPKVVSDSAGIFNRSKSKGDSPFKKLTGDEFKDHINGGSRVSNLFGGSQTEKVKRRNATPPSKVISMSAEYRCSPGLGGPK